MTAASWDYAGPWRDSAHGPLPDLETVTYNAHVATSSEVGATVGNAQTAVRGPLAFLSHLPTQAPRSPMVGLRRCAQLELRVIGSGGRKAAGPEGGDRQNKHCERGMGMLSLLLDRSSGLPRVFIYRSFLTRNMQ